MKPETQTAVVAVPGGSGLTVLIAGFEGALRAGVRNVISHDDDVRLHELDGVFNLRTSMAEHRPDALLLKETCLADVMELRRLVVTYPGTGVVIGVLEVDRERDQALLAAGARIVVPLTTCETELRAAVRLVARGLVGPPRVTHADGANGVTLLTEREAEVFRLLLRRRTAREIADALHIAIPTVNAHTRRIYDKLGVHSRSELEERAMGSEVVHPDRREARLSRDRAQYERRGFEARRGARPSALDMRAAMGVARWPRGA